MGVTSHLICYTSVRDVSTILTVSQWVPYNFLVNRASHKVLVDDISFADRDNVHFHGCGLALYIELRVLRGTSTENALTMSPGE